jgi:hypothetical protein
LRTRITLSLLAALLAASPSISYFHFLRPLQGLDSGGQHYFVVDEIIWQHARSDLQDLRIYSGEKEVPYASTIEFGSSETEQKTIRVLQPSMVGGKTQFLLDMSGLSEYDRISLTLATKNYVGHARVEGQNDARAAPWSDLGATTLYDLSDEKLGRNSTLQIPLTTFAYLRVTVDGPIKPSDVRGATAGITRAQKAVWRNISNRVEQTQVGKDTIFTISVGANVPVERIVYEVDPAQPNFRREIKIQDEKGMRVGAGEISRIHMQRNGQKIDVEQTVVTLSGVNHGVLKTIVHNGDDPPLKITSASSQQYERRIYFDSDSGSRLSLYYGDEKLVAPIYDYAKLFQKDSNAARIQLGPEQANDAYSGRPDDRPWSDRHPAVLWAAIIAAVLVLGGIALKSVKSASV